jgi:hypothetical protein
MIREGRGGEEEAKRRRRGGEEEAKRRRRGGEEEAKRRRRGGYFIPAHFYTTSMTLPCLSFSTTSIPRKT